MIAPAWISRNPLARLLSWLAEPHMALGLTTIGELAYGLVLFLWHRELNEVWYVLSGYFVGIGLYHGVSWKRAIRIRKVAREAGR